MTIQHVEYSSCAVNCARLIRTGCVYCITYLIVRAQYVLGADTVVFNSWYLQLLHSRPLQALYAYCTGLLLDDVCTNDLVSPDKVRTSRVSVLVGEQTVSLVDSSNTPLIIYWKNDKLTSKMEKIYLNQHHMHHHRHECEMNKYDHSCHPMMHIKW